MGISGGYTCWCGMPVYMRFGKASGNATWTHSNSALFDILTSSAEMPCIMRDMFLGRFAWKFSVEDVFFVTVSQLHEKPK